MTSSGRASNYLKLTPISIAALAIHHPLLSLVWLLFFHNTNHYLTLYYTFVGRLLQSVGCKLNEYKSFFFSYCCIVSTWEALSKWVSETKKKDLSFMIGSILHWEPCIRWCRGCQPSDDRCGGAGLYSQYFGRLKQKDCTFDASLDNLANPRLEIKNGLQT